MQFEELVKKLSPTLKRITYKLNGHFSFMNHDDLYQEALLHLWLDFQGGKLADKTDSYILQGCYFHLKNHIRKVGDKAKLASLDELAEKDGAGLERILASQDPKSYFDSLDNKILIGDIVTEALTKREKQVLTFYLEGLTVREIGKRIGVSHVRVIKLKNRLKQRCADLLR